MYCFTSAALQTLIIDDDVLAVVECVGIIIAEHKCADNVRDLPIHKQ